MRMHRLRHASLLARLVLAWFALSLGVAIASPLVKPQALQLVCSAAGTVKLVPGDADAGPSAAGHLLDCPLCAPGGAPGPHAAAVPRFLPPQPAPAAWSAWPPALAASAPLPARGPPVESA